MVQSFKPSQTINKATTMPIAEVNQVTGHSMTIVPEDMEVAIFGMGCFWGVERLFWQQQGVYSTAAGYSGGGTLHPTYPDVCSGQTGHAEVVHVVFDPRIISYQQLLRLFWENHDPAQGMRQGGDIGTQYRSALYWLTSHQQQEAENSQQHFQSAMQTTGDKRRITTEITQAQHFYYAEDYHQQYLHKNPEGYCALGGIGVCLPSQG